jgi:hypothetical protein
MISNTAIAICAIFYFLPAVIAWYRHASHFSGVLVLNLFTGWTLIGWIAAFIWACVSKEKETPTASSEPQWDKSAIYGTEQREKPPVANKLNSFTSSFRE